MRQKHMSEKQSYAADIVYKQIDGGWHQYTVSLRPGQITAGKISSQMPIP